jgi:hypothetical protein
VHSALQEAIKSQPNILCKALHYGGVQTRANVLQLYSKRFRLLQIFTANSIRARQLVEQTAVLRFCSTFFSLCKRAAAADHYNRQQRVMLLPLDLSKCNERPVLDPGC